MYATASEKSFKSERARASFRRAQALRNMNKLEQADQELQKCFELYQEAYREDAQGRSNQPDEEGGIAAGVGRREREGRGLGGGGFGGLDCVLVEVRQGTSRLQVWWMRYTRWAVFCTFVEESQRLNASGKLQIATNIRAICCRLVQ